MVCDITHDIYVIKYVIVHVSYVVCNITYTKHDIFIWSHVARQIERVGRRVCCVCVVCVLCMCCVCVVYVLCALLRRLRLSLAAASSKADALQ
jgi:hypothetical protein